MSKLIVLIIASVAVFIATFSLFYVFSSIGTIMKSCSFADPFATCKELTDITGPTLIMLFIIGGFFIVIPAVAYLILSR